MFILIHGASASHLEMRPIAKLLQPIMNSHAVDLLGHGGRPIPEQFLFSDLVEDLLRMIEEVPNGPHYLFGYSFGGLIALEAARRKPELVKGIVGLVLKHVYDEETIRHITHIANPDRVRRPGNPRLRVQEQYHGLENWAKVLLNNRALFQSFFDAPPLSHEALTTINTPVLLLSGEQDPLVSVRETRSLAGLLPNARVGLFPGPAHPLEQVPKLQVKHAVLNFVREVEQGCFDPSKPANMTAQLVAGGVTHPGISAKLRRTERF